MNIDVFVDGYDTGDSLILGGPPVEVIRNVSRELLLSARSEVYCRGAINNVK
jgi:hypothetical protein